MYSADDLLNKLGEIDDLIRERANPDGSAEFDTQQVMISLELARYIILRDENSE
jgi:hypothetical protein